MELLAYLVKRSYNKKLRSSSFLPLSVAFSLIVNYLYQVGLFCYCAERKLGFLFFFNFLEKDLFLRMVQHTLVVAEEGLLFAFSMEVACFSITSDAKSNKASTVTIPLIFG